MPSTSCERSKIQQVLLNILRNGYQIMQDNEIEQPEFIILTRFEKQRQMVVIEIEDMDEETRKRVFEPFWDAKPKGVGIDLGFSVSYFIITTNHNGDMSVESTAGTGAKFIICLPANGKTTPSVQ